MNDSTASKNERKRESSVHATNLPRAAVVGGMSCIHQGQSLEDGKERRKAVFFPSFNLFSYILHTIFFLSKNNSCVLLIVIILERISIIYNHQYL